MVLLSYRNQLPKMENVDRIALSLYGLDQDRACIHELKRQVHLWTYSSAVLRDDQKDPEST